MSGIYRLNRGVGNVGRMNVRRRRLEEPNATVWATTTTAGETVTLNRVTPSGGTCLVKWGDGQQETITVGTTTAITHVYAVPNTYQVQIFNPERITYFWMQNNKLTVNSVEIVSIVNVIDARLSSLKAGRFDSIDVSAWRPTTFFLLSMPAGYAGTFNSADISAWRPSTFYLYYMPADYAGTFNSADISAWRPTTFYMFSMQAGYAGTFNSIDVSAWRPTNFQLYSMPAGYAGTFNSIDVSAWRPTNFQMYYMPAGYAGTFNSIDISAWRPTVFYFYSMPAGYAGTFNSIDVSAWRPTNFYMHSMPASYSITITAGGFSGWTTTQYFYMYSNNLNIAQIDQILADFWFAFPARTRASGRMRIQNNAIPSGTYQPANPPTTGMEYKYELLNDSQNINPTYKWIEVLTDT